MMRRSTVPQGAGWIAVVAAVSLMACSGLTVPVAVSPEVADQIPDSASAVLIPVEDAETPFPRIVEELGLEGYTIVRADRESGTILTDGKEVGLNAMMRLSVVVSDTLVTILTDTRLSASGVAAMQSLVGTSDNQWVRATWSDAPVQFSRAVAFARGLEMGELTYRAP